MWDKETIEQAAEFIFFAACVTFLLVIMACLIVHEAYEVYYFYHSDTDMYGGSRAAVMFEYAFTLLMITAFPGALSFFANMRRDHLSLKSVIGNNIDLCTENKMLETLCCYLITRNIELESSSPLSADKTERLIK